MWPLREREEWGGETGAAEPGESALPELDRMQPAEVSTATFALG